MSGCGKSTLLRLVSGNIIPSKSNVYDGQLTIDSLTPLINTSQGNIGFMFQDATLLPNLTVLENVLLPLKIKKQKNFEFAYSLIEKVGLSKFNNYLPAQLSGGMKARVALARTFVSKPSLILLDEPFGDLDIKWRTQLYRELEMLREEFSATILMVTHDIHEALLLSNDIIVLGEEGKILEQIKIDKKLPRVFDNDGAVGLQEEYLKIRNLIINVN